MLALQAPRCVLPRGAGSAGRRRRARCLWPPRAALGPSSSGDTRGSFAAAKRVSLSLPALLVTLTVAEVVAEQRVAGGAIEAALGSGATCFVLEEGGAGAGPLYEAAAALRLLLRGRAALLVADRPDVAAAAEADGVLLSPDALPTVVARRALQESRLVLRCVPDAQAADTQAREGADALLLTGASPELVAAARRSVSVPLLVAGGAQLSALAAAGANGALMPLSAGAALLAGALAALRGGSPQAVAAPADQLEGAPPALLSAAGAALLASERTLLGSVLDFLAGCVPELAEAALLEEARAALDDPFLLVVAGEFNSGKSSVINALLGSRVLREGVLPTTNEISVLRYGQPGKPPKALPCADGHFDLFLPTPLLRQLSVVDTPGTNVILERQQRLTEEFIPRADLVLFVLSADRALTESEVRFLTYIRQWEKRVVFALNKRDLLQPQEVQEVRAFVATNAARLLGTGEGEGEVFPVSARLALQAKQAMPAPLAWGRPPPLLQQQPGWQQSGFAELEAFVARFLGGEQGTGTGEALRLKLLTPLSLAAALLDAAARALQAQAGAAAAELAACETVRRQLDAFRRDMEKDAQIQRQRVRDLVRAAALRGEKFVDAQLRLQNAGLLRALLDGRPAGLTSTTSLEAEGEAGGAVPPSAVASALAQEGVDSLAAAYGQQVVGTGMEELQSALAEHTQWLARNAARQRAHYAQVVASRGVLGDAAPVQALAEVQRSQGAPPPPSAASAVAQRFDQGAAALLLAEEVRQAALGTAGSAGAALALGTGLVALLPTFGEDALSLALAGLGAYVGLLNLPLRRQEVKAKLGRAADAFASELATAMEAELRLALDAALEEVQAQVAPWEAAAQAEAAGVAAAQARRELEDAKLAELQTRVLAL